MTTNKSGAPLRVLCLGRAFNLTKAINTGVERESLITQDKWP
jgi:hypothetical protein